MEGLSVEMIDEFSHGNFQRLFTSCLSAAHWVSAFRCNVLRRLESKEGASFPPCTTRRRMENGFSASLILSLGKKWRSVVFFTPRTVDSEKRAPYPALVSNE